MERDLEGKIALVTGGGRGMGRGIAERLAAAGARIGLLDAEPADAAVAAIEASGGQAFAIRAKIAPPDGIDAMLAQLDGVIGAGSGIDILVNNLGGGQYSLIQDTDIALFDWTFGLNVRVPFFITRALLPRLADGGRVVNISSAGARLADPGIIAYSMAKAAVDTFTKALAKQLGPRGITVNAVNPGMSNVDTNFEALQNPAVVEEITGNTLLGRVGQPADIADVVHALASPACRWVTGQIVEASGGYRL